MKKDEALRLVQELEEFLVREPDAGWNQGADAFFRERCRLLKMAVPQFRVRQRVELGGDLLLGKQVGAVWGSEGARVFGEGVGAGEDEDGKLLQVDCGLS